MNKILKTILEKFPRLGAGLYAFKHSSDRDYYNKAVQTDPSVFQFHTLGEKNPDKNIYLIRIGDPGDGFFAEFNRLLMYLYTADKYGFTPVIEFTESFLYYEENGVDGETNPFSYYFLQPSGLDPSDIKKSRNVVYSAFFHTLQPELMEERKGIYGFTDKYIENMGRIIKEYIRLVPGAERYVEEGIQRIGEGTSFERIIGVHFRGTDYRAGIEGHPEYLTPEIVIEKVKELMTKDGYDTVFLATDDNGALEKFKAAFGDALRYYDDVFRSDKDLSVAFSKDDRDLHHYKLGLEVLRDMETLSRCDSLIAGLSQVSLASRINKEALEQKYKELCILDPGIVTNGQDLSSYYRKEGEPFDGK